MTTWADAATQARTRAHAALVAAGVPSGKIALGNARLSAVPALSDTWARVTVREVDSLDFAYGSPRTFQDVAILAIELNVPVAQGEGPVRTLADLVRAQMAPGVVSGVQFGVPRLLPPSVEEGFYRALVLTDFASFYTA